MFVFGYSDPQATWDIGGDEGDQKTLLRPGNPKKKEVIQP